MKNEVIKDRYYRLVRGKAPECYLLQNRDKRSRRLLYYDSQKNRNRALRYAANYDSPFVDQQDENAIIEDIEFKNGFLEVKSTNPALQKFLEYSPDNGRQFVEIDYEKDAEKELELLDLEDLAKDKALEVCADVNTLETVGRIIFNKDVSRLTTQELKRDVRVYAKNNPKDFLALIDDTDKDLKGKVQRFFDDDLLRYRDEGRSVYYNLKDSKKKMLDVPPTRKGVDVVVDYLSSKDGVQVLKTLEQHLNI